MFKNGNLYSIEFQVHVFELSVNLNNIVRVLILAFSFLQKS